MPILYKMMGGSEVALAISLTTSRVKVHLRRDGFGTEPGNLLALSFNDAKVGISDERMLVFKNHLKELLTETADPVDVDRIRDGIDRVPSDARLIIGGVVELVRQGLSGPW